MKKTLIILTTLLLIISCNRNNKIEWIDPGDYEISSDIKWNKYEGFIGNGTSGYITTTYEISRHQDGVYVGVGVTPIKEFQGDVINLFKYDIMQSWEADSIHYIYGWNIPDSVRLKYDMQDANDFKRFYQIELHIDSADFICMSTDRKEGLPK